jgi:carbon monoxide dehydrogenase subunit G
MQMTGQERIAAPRQHVWEALDNPELLKRCIPGCQSLTKEDDGRLRAIAEIKIGPIGARFNATVARQDVNPPHGYTMIIEGQGGTVGFVKSHAKVRLTDEPGGGTLLSYDLEADVGGRLAQLGGAMLDATAKQMAGRFFRQLSANIGAPGAPVAVAKSTAAAPSTAPSTAFAPAAAARRGSPLTSLLALVVTALVGYLVGAAERGSHQADWMGLSLGLLVVIVAAVGFEFGRRASAPTLIVDSALLARLAEEAKR